MPNYPVPDEVEIAGTEYRTFLRPQGGRMWQSVPEASQPGDVGRPKPFPLEFHAGFGFSRRFTGGDGNRIGAGHHAYAQNVLTMYRAMFGPAPRIGYLNMADGLPAPAAGGFQLGGYTNSQLGGGVGAGSLGGGVSTEEPQFIREFGDGLYVGTSSRTFTLNPSEDTPTVEEVHDHGILARGRSADVFNNQLVVSLGSGTEIEVATSWWRSDSPTVWEKGEVKLDAVKTSGGGKLFAARRNLIFTTEADSDPLLALSYNPSVGEPVSTEDDPIRQLDEYLSGIVAGTVQGLRTLDPDAGFQGRGLVPRTRVSASAYAGRSLIAVGADMYFFTQRAAWLFRPGQKPLPIGLELLDHNNTPWIRGVPGVPDFDGQKVYVPYVFGSNSVIFAIEQREQGDAGEGPVAWNEFLYLEGRRARVVRYWGGSDTQAARLFFGAATDAEPESIGWVDMCDAPGPMFFRPGVGQPARTAVLYGGLDDYGTPGVRKGFDRVDIPYVEDADANNTLALAVTVDGSTFTTVGSVSAEGHAILRAAGATPVTGTEIGTRWTFTQAEAATAYVLARGTPLLYLFEVPDQVEAVTTLLQVPDDSRRESAEEVRAELAALLEAEPFELKHAGRTHWARMRAVAVTEFAQPDGTESQFAVQVTWVEIETD